MGERESSGPTLAITPIQIDPETETNDLLNVNNDAASDETEILRWSCVGAAGLFLMCSYDIGWITGLDTALSLLCGFQVGPLMDRYGPRLLAPVAVGLTVAKFFLLSECKNYWQTFLCLGVLGGIASAVASTVAISAVGKLFIRRRGLAMGAAMAGASLGGITFPLVLRRAFPALGWSWSNRVMGFVILGLMTIGMVLLLPFPKLILPSAVSSKKKSAALNFDAFRSGPFVFITLGFFLYEFSITGVGVLLPTFAVKAGFPSAMGYTLVSILNGCSCIGRLLPGLAGDYVGHFDVILFMTCLSLIFTGGLFVPFGGQSAGILYAFAGLWGFCTGSFLSILPGKQFLSMLYFEISF
ncbi:major facilitator superfamily transporter [Colletotrichum acutatum]